MSCRWSSLATCRGRGARAGVALVVAALMVVSERATPTLAAEASSPAATAGCGTPQQCFARMTDAQRGVARIRAGFRQTKRVALLTDPLVSTGRFTFERPDRVRWEMVTPEPLIVEIAGSSLRAGPPGAVADVDAGPAVGLFRDLGGIFAGASDYAGEERFTLGAGTSGPWSFVLTPRDPSVARVIRGIDIELDSASGGPRRVAIIESGGDRTEIELLDVVVERAAGDGAGS